MLLARGSGIFSLFKIHALGDSDGGGGGDVDDIFFTLSPQVLSRLAGSFRTVSRSFTSGYSVSTQLTR